MKKIIYLLFVMVLTVFTTMAQGTSKINYQAVVRDANNRLVTNNSNINVKIEIQKADNTVLYGENHTSVSSNANGLITLLVGDGTAETGTYDATDWAAAALFHTVVTLDGNTLEDVIVPISAVPFALYASNIDPAAPVVQDLYATIHNDSLVLANAINDLGDKVQADSATLHNALKDTAAAIRGDFPIVNDATLTIQINGTDAGTVTANQGTAETIDIAVPTNVSELEGIENYATLSKLLADSTALATAINDLGEKVQADSATLHNALKDTAAAIRGDFPIVNDATLTIQINGTDAGTFTANQGTAETINIDVPAAQVNSDWNATSGPAEILNKPDINNATLTIQKNGTDVGTFTANQSTDQTIDITVPTSVAELTDATEFLKTADLCSTVETTCSNVVLKDGDNTYTGANDFTNGSITVPNAIDDLSTVTATPCTQDAVSLCDLLAVFDSLNKRIAALESNLTAVAGNMSTPTITTAEATNVSLTGATIGGDLISAGRTTVTERGLCYSTTNTEPTITDTKVVVSGTETGAYSYNCTDLTAGLTYYVRAYVTTSEPNTYYGDVVTFTTATPELTVTPDQESPITACSQADVTYTVSMTGDDISLYSLAWYVDNVEQTGETDPEFTFTSNATATYTVKCVATRTGVTAEGSVDMDVTVYTSPEMTLTRREGNAGEDFGKVEITEANCVASAEWVYNGDVVGNWTSGKTAILPVGDYTVNITGVPGCGTATQTVTIRTSPVCIRQTTVDNPMETLYELAGKKYAQTIKDHQNNEYNLVQIGTRCWTRENMRATTSPSTGSYLVLNDVYLRNQASKAAIWPSYDSTNAVTKKWGAQYNWQAMVDVYNPNYSEVCNAHLYIDIAVPHITHPRRGICPEGWHLPQNGDLNDVHSKFNLWGQVAGNNADGTNSWRSASSNSPGNVSYEDRNVSGFSALPAGMDCTDNQGAYAIFWSGTEYGVASQNWRGYLYAIQYNYTNENWITQSLWHHELCAVRCLRDTKASLVLSVSQPSPVAPNASVTYTTKIVNGDASSYTYVWKVNNVVQSGETSSSFTTSFTQRGNYTVTCEATNGTETLSQWTNTSIRESPVLSTNTPTNVTCNRATIASSVSGFPINERGVCISTTANPELNATTRRSSGSGEGNYSINLTGLTPNTTYYVRSYCIGGEGVVYGNEVSFTTSNTSMPVASTAEATNVSQTEATVGGNVTDVGCPTMSEHGVCYSTTNAVPEISGTGNTKKTVSGTTAGEYTVALTGLTANTTYYVRAYVTNSQGTQYGDVITFTTLP